MFKCDLTDEDELEIEDELKSGCHPDDIVRNMRERGRHTTVGQVRAFLRGAGLKFQEASVDVEHEVWATLVSNLSDLDEVEARLRELDTVAMQNVTGTARPVRLALTRASLAQRAEIILEKHKVLQHALTSRARRRLLEAQAAVLESARPAPPPPASLPAAAPSPAALPPPVSLALPAAPAEAPAALEVPVTVSAGSI